MAASSSAGMGGAGRCRPLPDRSSTRPPGTPSRLASDPHGPGVQAGDRDPVDVVRGRARRPSARRATPARPAARTSSRRSAPPTAWSGVAGDAPAVDELLGGRADPRYSATTGPAASSPTSSAAAAVAPGRLVAARQADADVRGHDERVAGALERAPQRPDPRARRAAEVERAAVGVEAERGVDRGGVGLVEVRRAPVVEKRASGWRASGRARRASRAASTPMRRGVLVVRGDGAGALAAALAEKAAISARSSRR